MFSREEPGEANKLDDCPLPPDVDVGPAPQAGVILSYWKVRGRVASANPLAENICRLEVSHIAGVTAVQSENQAIGSSNDDRTPWEGKIKFKADARLIRGYRDIP